MNEQEALRLFKTRVVKARNAYVCCRKGFLRSAQYALEVMDFVRENFLRPPLQSATVVLPRVEPVIRVTGVPKTPGLRPMVYGVVDIESGSQLSAFDGPTTDGELQACAQLVNAITETQRKATQDCIRCIERALLGNSKRRQSVTVKLAGKKNRLNLRVPHR